MRYTHLCVSHQDDERGYTYEFSSSELVEKVCMMNSTCCTLLQMTQTHIRNNQK